ncbi:hypothetical protein CHUAL_004788 [Chamberlinius hualienensis]
MDIGLYDPLIPTFSQHVKWLALVTFPWSRIYVTHCGSIWDTNSINDVQCLAIKTKISNKNQGQWYGLIWWITQCDLDQGLILQVLQGRYSTSSERSQKIGIGKIQMTDFFTLKRWTMQGNMHYSNFYNKFSLASAMKIMFRVRHEKSYECGMTDGDSSHEVNFNGSNNNGPTDRWNAATSNDECDTRTWSGEHNENAYRKVNIVQLVFSNLSVMITLGICVITGHVANDVAGPAVISSLIIAAVTSLLSGLCYTEFQTNRLPSSNNIYSCFYQNVGEFPAFIVGWNQILLHVSAIAATGRSLSAVLDYISGNQLQAFWVERLPTIPSLNTSPDLIAFSFVVLTSLPFGLGMKWSKRMSYFVTVLAISVVILFVVLGVSYLDGKGWSAHHFLSYESTRLLSGAAIYTCGFCSYYLMTNSKPLKTPKRCVPAVVGVTLTGCFMAYFTVAITSTLLVHNRNVDADVSLVDVFKTHNLHWAVYVVGAGDAVCLAILLLNLSNNLNLTTLTLAFDGLIFRCIARRWKPLKTPLVPVLLFGGGAGLAAILFPIPSLLEVMALPSLIINTLVCVCVLHQRYQPINPWQYSLIPQEDSSPVTERPHKRRNTLVSDSVIDPDEDGVAAAAKQSKESTIRINRRDIFPMVKQTSFSSADSGGSEDGLQLNRQPSCESESSTADDGGIQDDSDAESSTTDIDTIVAEYKEKLRVATLTDSDGFNLGLNLQQSLNMEEFNYERFPTPATGRRVGISVIGLIIAYFILSFLLVLKRDAVARGNAMIIILLSSVVVVVMILLIVILRQPEINQANSGYGLPLKVFQVPFLPWIPAIAAFLNVCMLTNIMCRHWAPGVVWLAFGVAVYFLYGIWNSSAADGFHHRHRATKEKIRLQPLPRQPFLSFVLPVHSEEVNHRITEVDTILISR